MVISKIDLGLTELRPYWPVLTGHTQTLLGHFVPTPVFKELGETIHLQLPDGDFCGLQIFVPPNGKNEKVLSLYHGLAGNHQSDYMQRSARLAYDRGWTVVWVDHRGAGIAEGMARHPYHSGRGEDASEVIGFLRKKFPQAQQIAAGFSMSGSILLNLVTGRRGVHKPDFTICVNAPINLKKASELLTNGLSKIYDIRFYRRLKKDIQKNYGQKIPFLKQTHYVDDHFTSVRSGYLNKDDYYEKCSTYKYVQNVSVPTFILTAKDDPFIAFEDYRDLKWPDCVHVTYSNYGGHVGYYSKDRLDPFNHRWLDHYLDRVFSTISSL